jgi:hypothetical protein
MIPLSKSWISPWKSNQSPKGASKFRLVSLRCKKERRKEKGLQDGYEESR